MWLQVNTSRLINRANENSPFAVKYGMRPVDLAPDLLMGVACIWLAIASKVGYMPLITGRAFLAAFEAPIESIVPSTI